MTDNQKQLTKAELIHEFEKLQDKWKHYEATSMRMKEVKALIVRLKDN